MKKGHFGKSLAASLFALLLVLAAACNNNNETTDTTGQDKTLPTCMRAMRSYQASAA